MKKLYLVIMALCMVFTAFAKDIQELVVTTQPPMSCQNCENKIKGNLRFEKGVKKIETNIPEQRVTVEYDADKTTPQKIEEAFEKIGYHVEVIENQTTSSGCAGACCQGK